MPEVVKVEVTIRILLRFILIQIFEIVLYKLIFSASRILAFLDLC